MKGIKDNKGKFARNLPDKECLQCGIVFHPRFANRKYCSKKCDGLSKTKDRSRSCIICKISFSARSIKTKFCSQECYTKSGIRAPKGEKNPHWKGGITPINRLIRNSIENKLWRKAVFERDKYTCVWCGQVSGRLNADHIKPFALYPELRFAIDNGRTLCLSCHIKTDTYGGRIHKNIRK